MSGDESIRPPEAQTAAVDFVSPSAPLATTTTSASGPDARPPGAAAGGGATEQTAGSAQGQAAAGEGQSSSSGLRSSRGWDGKLRVSPGVHLLNPEAISDPEYSDDDFVIPGEEIAADEDLLVDEDSDTDEIVCSHARVQSIAALSFVRFRCCQRLCLRQNNIMRMDTKALAPLGPTLHELDLYDNLVSHVPHHLAKTLPHLTSLDLSYNKIRHIRNLAGLAPTLEELYLVANKIRTMEVKHKGDDDGDGDGDGDGDQDKEADAEKQREEAEKADTRETAKEETSGDDVSELSRMAKLRVLELGSNRIREIRGLDSGHLVALEELWLAKNKLTSLAGLAGLPRLRVLSVQSNRIRDLAPLRTVPTLEELYLSHNMLQSLESLVPARGDDGRDGKTEKTDETSKTNHARSILPNLRTLDISNNQISTLRGVEGLTRLEELWASFNRIADFADVQQALADKANLETVYFEGNILQLRAPALYRNKVRLALPQVRQVDATYIRE